MPIATSTLRDEGGMTACGQSLRVEKLGSLLVYLPDHSVIICKTCEFAIQPKALPSHLLRHHIYREKRQNLLDRIAKVPLLEPDQVPLPTNIPAAFAHLTVASGYRCMVVMCTHLCISQKRMNQHLRDNHPDIDGTHAAIRTQNVYIQTFFRGNKIRYFEVSPSNAKGRPDSPQRPSGYRFVDSSNEHEVDSRRTKKNQQPQPPHSLSQNHLPMEDLLYLHHYITSTALSLARGDEPVDLWTHDLPLQASNQPFLMHGFLGVAAFHQALLAADTDDRRRHQSAGLGHQAAGLATFRSLIDNPTQETSTALTAFARMLGVQNCAQALLEAEKTSSLPKSNEVSVILECMLLLRGGLEILLGMQGLLPAGSGLTISAQVLEGLEDLEMPNEMRAGPVPYLANEIITRLTTWEGIGSSSWPHLDTLTKVRHFVSLCSSISELAVEQVVTDGWLLAISPHLVRSYDDVRHVSRICEQSRRSAELLYHQSHIKQRTALCPPLLCYPNIPAAIYAKLAQLPSQLMIRVATPHMADIEAFNQAMAALISSFSRSYATDTEWSRWNGIESWTRMLSDRFLDMIRGKQPLALVLVAHWCVLLSMQEERYWFLRGRSQRMLNIILRCLDADMRAFLLDFISPLIPAG